MAPPLMGAAMAAALSLAMPATVEVVMEVETDLIIRLPP